VRKRWAKSEKVRRMMMIQILFPFDWKDLQNATKVTVRKTEMNKFTTLDRDVTSPVLKQFGTDKENSQDVDKGNFSLSRVGTVVRV
jgi:hypothetical protein